MTELFYNFSLGKKNHGYSYLRWDDAHLYSFTRFALPDAPQVTNVFRLRLDRGVVRQCRHGSGAWVDLSQLPPDHYPGCAYPLILPKAQRHPFRYVQVSEEDGSVQGPLLLERKGNDIEERAGDRVVRLFTFDARLSPDGGCPVEIDWGGAISRLCESGVDSARGSGLLFEVDPF